MIIQAFVEANFKTLESLMKDYVRQTQDEGLQRELEYSSDDYDEEIEVKPRPPTHGQAHAALRIGSPVIRETSERTVRFEGISERDSNVNERIEKERSGEESNRITGNGGNKEVNLPPLLVAHQEMTEAGVLLQPFMASGYVGNMPSVNQGGNLSPNGMYAPFQTQSYSNNLHPPLNGQTNHPSYAYPYAPHSNMPFSQPSTYQPTSVGGNPSFEGYPPYQPFPNHHLSSLTYSATPFVRWIEDYPLPDGLKMPTHIAKMLDQRSIQVGKAYTLGKEDQESDPKRKFVEQEVHGAGKSSFLPSRTEYLRLISWIAKCIVDGIIPNFAIAVLPKSIFWEESYLTIRNVICSLLWCGDSPTVIRRLISTKGLTYSPENPDNVV
nr:hypothetical protein [Tanacetum cinerariifolium]